MFKINLISEPGIQKNLLRDVSHSISKTKIGSNSSKEIFPVNTNKVENESVLNILLSLLMLIVFILIMLYLKFIIIIFMITMAHQKALSILVVEQI